MHKRVIPKCSKTSVFISFTLYIDACGRRYFTKQLSLNLLNLAFIFLNLAVLLKWLNTVVTVDKHILNTYYWLDICRLEMIKFATLHGSFKIRFYIFAFHSVIAGKDVNIFLLSKSHNIQILDSRTTSVYSMCYPWPYCCHHNALSTDLQERNFLKVHRANSWKTTPIKSQFTHSALVYAINFSFHVDVE